MRKKLATSQRSVQHELAAIALVLRQINAGVKELITVDEEAEERERSYRLIPSVPPRPYLCGRWKNQDGDTYHPLDPKGGALEEMQKEYQADLVQIDREKIKGRNTDPE